MSAITGIFRRDGKAIDPAEIKKMNDKLAHRGPDGSRIWCRGSVALAQQMLYSTPESLHEVLPFEHEEFGLVITADARIDNRQELSELLELEDKENVPDSLFILKAYEKWGENCPEKFLGDFAFVIWDNNNRKLFCARDHMGVKPFYYHISHDLFAFSTEIKALLTLDEVKCVINELRIGYYLTGINQDRNITFYEDVFRLPAAHTFILDDKNCKLDRYWSLNPKFEIKMGSNEDYEKSFLKIFEEAVKCRLRSNYAVGVELSGGLDSSSVFCVSQNLMKGKKNNLKSFSVLFENLKQCDESYYIKKVLEKCNSDSYYIFGDKISPLKELDSIIWHMEEPFFGIGIYMFRELHATIKENNLCVVLNGFEGDSTVSHGTEFFYELLMERRCLYLLKEIRARAKVMNKRSYKYLLYSISPLIPDYIKKFWNLFFNQENYNKILQKIINKRFIERINLREHIDEEYNGSYNKMASLREYHFKDLNSGNFQHRLEEYDRFSSMNQLEFRFPFFDKRLIEFCLALPPSQKLRDGWDRIIERKSMEGLIPKEVQWRSRKTDLGPNLDQTFLKYGRNYLKDLFDDESRMVWDYIDIEYLKNLFDEYTSQEIYFLSYIFYKVIILDLWLSKQTK